MTPISFALSLSGQDLGHRALLALHRTESPLSIQLPRSAQCNPKSTNRIHEICVSKIPLVYTPDTPVSHVEKFVNPRNFNGQRPGQHDGEARSPDGTPLIDFLAHS